MFQHSPETWILVTDFHSGKRKYSGSHVLNASLFALPTKLERSPSLKSEVRSRLQHQPRVWARPAWIYLKNSARSYTDFCFFEHIIDFFPWLLPDFVILKVSQTGGSWYSLLCPVSLITIILRYISILVFYFIP